MNCPLRLKLLKICYMLSRLGEEVVERVICERAAHADGSVPEVRASVDNNIVLENEAFCFL